MNGNVSSRWISHHFFVNVKSAIIHAEQISTLGGGRELFVFARSFNCLQMIENNVTKSMYSLDNGQVAYSLHLSNSAWNISAAKNCDKFTVSASHNDWRPEQWEYPLAFEYFSRLVSRWDFYILNFACNSFFSAPLSNKFENERRPDTSFIALPTREKNSAKNVERSVPTYALTVAVQCIKDGNGKYWMYWRYAKFEQVS